MEFACLVFVRGGWAAVPGWLTNEGREIVPLEGFRSWTSLLSLKSFAHIIRSFRSLRSSVVRVDMLQSCFDPRCCQLLAGFRFAWRSGIGCEFRSNFAHGSLRFARISLGGIRRPHPPAPSPGRSSLGEGEPGARRISVSLILRPPSPTLPPSGRLGSLMEEGSPVRRFGVRCYSMTHPQALSSRKRNRGSLVRGHFALPIPDWLARSLISLIAFS